MDTLDGKLLNLIQRRFPLEARPYLALSQDLGVSETDVIDRISDLRRKKVIRQISAIFDTRSLGYQSTLVAAKVPPARLRAAAQIFNAHPGVSHNYERDSEFNLWFTIAVPPNSDLQATVERMGDMAAVDSIRILPTLRLFKIGVALDVAGEDSLTAVSVPQYTEYDRARASTSSLTERDVEVIRVLQEDLPMDPRPFDEWAATLAIEPQGLFDLAADLAGKGFLRRFAAILHHRKAGFTANCMAVWQLPEGSVIEAGEAMARFSAVSHCYQRPTYSDWKYNIFTMIHGRSKAECDAVIGAITEETQPLDVARIYSTREYKKTRVRYFTPELDNWERANLPAPQVEVAPG